MRRLALGLVLFALTGCSAIVGDEVSELRPDLELKRDVSISLRDFGPHVEQLIRVEWVENFELLEEPPARAPLVLATAVVDPAPSDCMDIRLRRGAPFGASRIDFYADLNMNGMLDPPEGGDHSWRETVQEDGGLVFVHDVQFEDLTMDPGQALLSTFEVEITGAEEQNAALATVLLVGEDLVDPVMDIRRRTVSAMYVTPVEDGTLSLSLPGVADPGVFYDVEVRFGDNALVCTIDEQRTPTDGSPLRLEGALDSFTCAPGEAPNCADFSDRCDAGDREACADLHWQCAFVDCGR